MSWVGWIVEQMGIAGWFFTGVYFARETAPGRRIEVVPGPERLPQAMREQIDEMTFEARTVGRGFVSTRNLSIRIGGVWFGCALTCDTDQFATAPEKEKRR